MDACQLEKDRVRVVCIDDDTLLDEVARFRYSVYIDQMQRNQKYADHVKKKIVEPLDEQGTNLAVFRGDQIIGVIRGNFFSDGACKYYHKIYKIDRFKEFNSNEVILTTKLMVLPEFRKSTALPKLLRAYATFVYKAGIKLVFIDCNKPLIPMFERMGYFSYTGWAFHKEFGTVRPMFLAVDTLQYQQKLRSVLYEPAQACLVDNQYDGYETVRRYAELPMCETTAKIAIDFFNP